MRARFFSPFFIYIMERKKKKRKTEINVYLHYGFMRHTCSVCDTFPKTHRDRHRRPPIYLLRKSVWVSHSILICKNGLQAGFNKALCVKSWHLVFSRHFSFVCFMVNKVPEMEGYYSWQNSHQIMDIKCNWISFYNCRILIRCVYGLRIKKRNV